MALLSPAQPRGDTAALASGVILRIDNVSRRFTTRRHDTLALDQVSLDVREGEFVCVVGPSGCGKSTLLNIVAGFDKPTSGRVEVAGVPVRKPGRDRVVVFQEHALFPWLSVLANVEFGLRIAGVGRRERREKARELLSLVGLDRFERAYVHELSGGMKQRVQIARSLAVNPQMLLMDEPFAALDAQTRDTLLTEVQRIWQETHKTVLFITHNVLEAVLLADRVVVMASAPGRIQQIIDVDMPHPRSPYDHEVVDLAATIRRELGVTL